MHFATFTSLAFAVDPLLLASCWWATAEWDPHSRQYAIWAQFIFMFAFTKIVKLAGLFLRNPSDVIFLPVSVIFGYLHGLIKLYALITLNMVCFFFFDSWPNCFLSSRTSRNLAGLFLRLHRPDILGQPTRWRRQRRATTGSYATAVCGTEKPSGTRVTYSLPHPTEGSTGAGPRHGERVLGETWLRSIRLEHIIRTDTRAHHTCPPDPSTHCIVCCILILIQGLPFLFFFFFFLFVYMLFSMESL